MEHKRLKFLIVDDDKVTTDILGRMLAHAERDIFIASNGEEGLKRFKQVAPDIILSDVSMPEMNGLEMIAQIRRNDQDVKIAIFTNFDNKEYMLKAIELGVNQFFAKPFKRQHFLQVIETLSEDILSKRFIECSLKRHQNMLSAINNMSSKLLRYNRIEETLHEQMRLIKEAAEASMLFIFKNDAGTSPRFARQFLQINDNSDASPTPLMPYSRFEKTGWLEQLQAGQVINDLLTSYQSHELPFFYQLRINSLLLLPLFVGNSWWGILGIGNNELRRFDDTDISTLKTVAQIVGSAFSAQQSISQLEMRSAIFKHTVDGIIMTDSENKIMQINEAFEDISGFSTKQVLGRNPSIFSSGKQDTAFYKQMWDDLKQKGHWSGEISNRKANGEVYVAWVRINVIYHPNGSVKNYIGIFSDFTARHDHEQMYRKMATLDALTGLSNRLILDDRLSQALLHAEHAKSSVALVFIDLDNFKPINDTYGHRSGDVILQQCAKHFKSSVRAEDTICRYGGDEFVIILESIKQVSDLDLILQKIIQITHTPVTVENVTLDVQMSVGVAMYPQDAKNSQELLQHADTAMYGAKKSGKNQVCFFNDTATSPEHTEAM